MKKTIKLFAFILATLMLVSFIPLAAFAEEIETEAENTETDTAEPIEESSSESVEATSEGEISSDTENEETETMVFEFIEEEAPTINPRIVGPGMEDFDPTDPTPDYIQITSSIVPDGVYSLQNIGNTGLWMDIEQSKTDAGYHVQQYAYSDNPAGTLFDRAGLFKISRKSNGLYVIRLMLNNRLSFGFVGNEVITKEIEVVDANVPDTDCFTITYISGSYIIKPYNSPYAISAKNTTASGLSGAPDSYLAKRTAADAGDRAKWQMYKYNRSDRSGSTVYYTSSWKTVGIPVSTTGTMSCKTWTTKIGANTPFKREAANSSAMISTSYDFTTFKMSFEALRPGKATIYSMILEADTEPSVYTAYSYFQIIPQEGTYLIRNEKTEKYIDIKGPNTNEGTLIHQWAYGESSSRRWIVEHVSGGEGFVRIKSAYSNKYIAVDSTTNTTIKQTSTLNDYALWKFERTPSGNIKLICKAIGETRALSILASSNDNGANLTMATYTEDENYIDEWLLVRNRLDIEIIFDQGYIERHRKTGESDSVVIERISNNIRSLYYHRVSIAFEQLFGIELILTVLSDYVSDADLCPKNGINEKCNCVSVENCVLRSHYSATVNNTTNGFVYSCHCTSLLRIRNNLIVNIPSKTIRVAYSGHEMCYYSSNGHSYGTIAGVSSLDYPIICMTEKQNGDNSRSTLVLFHELLHTFGVSHHNGGNDLNCVMNIDNTDRYDDIELSNPFDYLCDDCALTVIENFDKY